MPSPNWQTIKTSEEYMALTQEDKDKHMALVNLKIDGMDQDSAIYMVEHGIKPKGVVVFQTTDNTSVASGLVNIIKRRDDRQDREDIDLKNALKVSISSHQEYVKKQAEKAEAYAKAQAEKAEAQVAQAKAEAEAHAKEIYDWRIAYEQEQLLRKVNIRQMELAMEHREQMLRMEHRLKIQELEIRQMRQGRSRALQMMQNRDLSPSASYAASTASVDDVGEALDQLNWRQPLASSLARNEGAAGAGARNEAGVAAGARDEVGAAAEDGVRDSNAYNHLFKLK